MFSRCASQMATNLPLAEFVPRREDEDIRRDLLA